jgi:molybdenum cofactor cytidylyltransferase
MMFSWGHWRICAALNFPSGPFHPTTASFNPPLGFGKYGSALDPGFGFLYFATVRDESPAGLVFGVVILAAGKSSRMGCPKLLLPWGSTTVLGHLIASWQALRARQIAVVSDASQHHIAEELERLHFPVGERIPNPNPERGMFSSIRCAAAWTGWDTALTHLVVALGDQPQLRPETLGGLLQFGGANRSKICQPRYNGRSRHPILLPKSAFLQLRSDPASDMKAYLMAHAADCAGFDAVDPGLELDLDTPTDYERMRAVCFPTQ